MGEAKRKRELALAGKIEGHENDESGRVRRYDFAAKAEVAAYVKAIEKQLRSEINEVNQRFVDRFEKEETFDDLVANNIEMLVDRVKELELTDWQRLVRRVKRIAAWFGAIASDIAEACALFYDKEPENLQPAAAESAADECEKGGMAPLTPSVNSPLAEGEFEATFTDTFCPDCDRAVVAVQEGDDEPILCDRDGPHILTTHFCNPDEPVAEEGIGQPSVAGVATTADGELEYEAVPRPQVLVAVKEGPDGVVRPHVTASMVGSEAERLLTADPEE